MIRFFLIVSFLVVSGYVLLAAISPELAGSYVFFIFGIIGAAAILKISLDLYLFRKEEKRDDSNNSLSDSSVKPIYDLKGYQREVERRQRRRS